MMTSKYGDSINIFLNIFKDIVKKKSESYENEEDPILIKTNSCHKKVYMLEKIAFYYLITSSSKVLIFCMYYLHYL